MTRPENSLQHIYLWVTKIHCGAASRRASWLDASATDCFGHAHFLLTE